MWECGIVEIPNNNTHWLLPVFTFALSEFLKPSAISVAFVCFAAENTVIPRRIWKSSQSSLKNQEAIAKPPFAFATGRFGVWEIGRKPQKASETPSLQAAKAIRAGLPLVGFGNWPGWF